MVIAREGDHEIVSALDVATGKVIDEDGRVAGVEATTADGDITSSAWVARG